MDKTDRSIVAGVFSNETDAQQAMADLQNAGFTDDQIRYSAHKGGNGILDSLLGLGFRQDEANYYNREFLAGRTIVTVMNSDHQQEAADILQRNGAYAAGSRTSQTATIATTDTATGTDDKQRAVWDQAVASHQAYLAEQLASNTQEDFHRPRSLKPREERLPVTTHRVQAEEAELCPAMVTEQQPGAAPLVQQDEVTEQKPMVTPVTQHAVVMQQKPSVAPVVQNDQVREQLPLAEEENRETTPIDDGETLRRLRNHAQGSAQVLPPPTQPEKHRNRALVKNGVLLGGVLLGLSTGVLVALLRREQIRQFVLSTARTMKAQRTSITRINHDDQKE